MRYVFAALMLLGLLVGSPAMAGDREVAAIKAILAPGPLDSGLFTPQFLDAVPPAQLGASIDKIKQQIGPVVDVSYDSGNSYTVETAGYELPVDIVLNPSGKIAGLLLRPPTARNASLSDLLTQMQGLAANSAYLVTRNGQPLQSSNPDKPLAVGSAFKLGILKVLKDEVTAGTRKWSDVVTLDQADVSLPSGILQQWPVGSPLTFHTLASLMISMSDNTATDTLMHLVGRDKVEAALGISPVLTTREVFVLKANAALRARYAMGDEAAKRDILKEADTQPLPDVASALTPYDDAIEYNLSPAKLCELMETVADLDVFGINPGVARPSDWTSVAFKGGSETGVLSMTTRVIAKDGTSYCVSAIWNVHDKDVDSGKAQAAYAGVLARLAKGANP